MVLRSALQVSGLILGFRGSSFVAFENGRLGFGEWKPCPSWVVEEPPPCNSPKDFSASSIRLGCSRRLLSWFGYDDCGNDIIIARMASQR